MGSFYAKPRVQRSKRKTTLKIHAPSPPVRSVRGDADEEEPIFGTTDDAMRSFVCMYTECVAQATCLKGAEEDELAVESRVFAVDVLSMLYERSEKIAGHSYASEVRAPIQQDAEKYECSVCYDDECEPVVARNCGHAPCCGECMTNYIMGLVRSKKTTPWITCPEADCNALLHLDTIDAALSTSDLLEFLIGFMHQYLTRRKGWVDCTTEGCRHGALNPSGEQQCGGCNAVLEAVEADDEIQKMVQSGVLRGCPVCEHLTTKDYGMCNIMQCQQCGVWWNWRDRSYSRKSMADLKQKARAAKTLWEPGELQYQLELEQKQPEKFRELLERNGIEYDPSYRRGG